MSGVDNMYPTADHRASRFRGARRGRHARDAALAGEGGEPTFLTTQHGMGLIPAEVRARGPWGRLLGGKLALLSNRYDA